MTMLEPSQPTFFDGMALPLMSSRAASRARTLALLESSAAWVKEPAAASGPRSSDLLASYDRNTSSWRTSQHCLLAQANGEADGLAEFSETWPSAGMMRNGKTYRLQPWALPIAENASGLLLTPIKTDASLAMTLRDGYSRSKAHSFGSLSEQLITEFGCRNSPRFAGMMMGFPPNWALTETA